MTEKSYPFKGSARNKQKEPGKKGGRCATRIKGVFKKGCKNAFMFEKFKILVAKRVGAKGIQLPCF